MKIVPVCIEHVEEHGVFRDRPFPANKYENKI